MQARDRDHVPDKADEVQRGAEEGVGGGDAEDGDAEPAGRRQDGADAAGEGHARHTGRAPVVSRDSGVGTEPLGHFRKYSSILTKPSVLNHRRPATTGPFNLT